LLTIVDVAAWLGVSKGWVYDHTTRKQPRLPCIRLGEMTRFRREDVEKFIEEHARRASGSK
jgi:excisionase family DNA binding protein